MALGILRITLSWFLKGELATRPGSLAEDLGIETKE
jgi:hypothetical protein